MKKRYIAMLKLEGLHSQVGVDVGEVWVCWECKCITFSLTYEERISN